MIKEILNWTDKKMEEIENNPDDRNGYLKAFGLGFIEGYMEFAIIAYPFVVVSALAWKKQALKK